jgi:hypothetical protein
MTILGFVGQIIYNEVSFYACFYFSLIKHHSNLYSFTLKNNVPQHSAGNVSSILEKRFDSFKQKNLQNVESFKMTATSFAFNFMLFIRIDGQHLLLFLHFHKTLYRLQAQYKIVLTCPFYRFQMQ